MSALDLPLASPYREEHADLVTRELILEQELASVRAQLHALTDEEVRLSRNLAEVRGELAARRRTEGNASDARQREATRRDRLVAYGVVALAAGIVAATAAIAQLECTDTARRAPPDVSGGWPGPAPRGFSWLYVEAPLGTTVTIDGRGSTVAPARFAFATETAHDVVFGDGKRAHLWPVPCTTAVVRYEGVGDVSVDRYYDSNNCL